MIVENIFLEVKTSYSLRGSLLAKLFAIDFLNLQLMSVAQETWSIFDRYGMNGGLDDNYVQIHFCLNFFLSTRSASIVIFRIVRIYNVRCHV